MRQAGILIFPELLFDPTDFERRAGSGRSRRCGGCRGRRWSWGRCFYAVHREEFGDGGEFVAFGGKGVEGAGHRGDGTGVNVVDEDDPAGSGSIDDLAGDAVGVPVFPIERIDGPHDGLHAKFFVVAFVQSRVGGSVGRTHGGWDDAGGVDDGGGGAIHLALDRGGSQLGHGRMVPGVIPDLVALRDHALEDLGVGGGVGSDDVERRFDPAFLEDIEELGRELRTGAVVEGHRDNLSVGIDGVVGMLGRSRGRGGSRRRGGGRGRGGLGGRWGFESRRVRRDAGVDRLGVNGLAGGQGQESGDGGAS